MKKLKILILLAAGIIAFAPATGAQAALLNIDFENLHTAGSVPPDPLSSDSFYNLGAETDVFSMFPIVSGWGDGWYVYNDVLDPAYTNWGLNQTFINAEGTELFISFLEPVTLVSMDLILPAEYTGAVHPGGVGFSDGRYLSDSIDLDFANLTYNFDSRWTNVNYLTFFKDNESGTFTLDNLVIDTADDIANPVPEPGTVSLVGFGLLMSAFFGLRKKGHNYPA